MLGVYTTTTWLHHGERKKSISTPETRVPSTEDRTAGTREDDMLGMFRDLYPGVNVDIAGCEEVLSQSPDDSITAWFHKLLEESRKELNPGFEKTMLSLFIRFWQMKCLNGLSNNAFMKMLNLFRENLPEGCNLPENFTQCKKLISDLGLSYNKIDACRNDCSKEQTCIVCGESRWIKVRAVKKKNTPAKVLRHFPLAPRLQQLYMSSKTAEDMRWHEKGRPDDGIMRHPADSLAWKHFNETNPKFASDLRNVRLGLASDGFSPFGTMTTKHSTWPVGLFPYNLPRWLCMKQPHFMLSLLIPGRKSLGNDMDIYLRPLIEELKELWSVGVEIYDSFTKEKFQMLAAVMWTISDFPGLAMLSGNSTKVKKACRLCHEKTEYLYLKNGRKLVTWPIADFANMHKFRGMSKEFDGKTEYRTAPIPLIGKLVVRKLEGIPHKFGK